MGRKSRRVGKVVGVIVAALVAVVAVVFITQNPVGIGVGRGVQRAGTCQECHPAQYREWHDGQAAAFAAITAPFMKGQAEEFAGFGCWKCHDPFKLGVDEGVTCEYCHGKTGDLDEHAGQCEGRAALLDVVRQERFCHRCHSVVHPITKVDFQGTVGEWETSPAGRGGITCQGCHMPLVGEGEAKHHFHGHYYPGRSPLANRPAVSIEDITFENGRVSVVVKNHVRGHYLPTGGFTNAMVLEVKGLDDGGVPVFEDEFPFAKRFKFRKVLGIQEFPWKVTMDTRLKPEEQRTIEFDVDTPARIMSISASVRCAFLGDKGLVPECYTSEPIASKEVVF
jgi:hypothetical protein